ncbi:MAG: DUF1569 domain-containing protein [Pseudomarimonas sp.]
MQRRKLIKAVAFGGAGALLVGAGVVAFAPRPAVAGYASFAQVRAQLDTWRALGGAPAMDSGWPIAQVLAHCAQSIEYSLHGFPALKPAWFRSTVGPAAFAAFDVRGAMHHSLVEPIPGAPVLEGANWPEALMRLEAAITAFEQHTGAFEPHFAYGMLDRAEYERAHLMHFSQHMSLVRGS